MGILAVAMSVGVLMTHTARTTDNTVLIHKHTAGTKELRVLALTLLAYAG